MGLRRLTGYIKCSGSVYTIKLHSDTSGSWCPKGFICSGFHIKLVNGVHYIQHFTELGELGNLVEIRRVSQSGILLKYPKDRRLMKYKRIG